MSEDFIEKNIGRLIKQFKGGDEAITFLAIYSFIEGYLRNKYPEKFPMSGYYAEGKWQYYTFDKIIKSFIKFQNLQKHDDKYAAFLTELIRYHGKGSECDSNIDTQTDTNHIRHCFSNIRKGTLFVVVNQFIKFAKHQGFLTEEISDMNINDSVVKSREEIESYPVGDSILYSLKNDLLEKYDFIKKCRKEKENIEIEVEEIEEQIENESDEVKLVKLIKQRQEKSKKIKAIDLQFGEVNEYINFINELAVSLIEARSKKNYETQIIHLSDTQKKLIKEDIDALTTKPGQSMYIKGGPGTGKTLVLIVVLFRLYSKDHTSKLLTYYPTLNKYISYLFELYNDDKLLNYFGVKKIDVESLNILRDTGILKFDDFLLPKIMNFLKVKSVYSINDKVSELKGIFDSVESNPQKATKLWEEVMENILPNMIDEEKYGTSTSPRKKERWQKISQILEKLDNNEDMLDLYVYYKFGLKDINKQALINESFDYILIDEAQDLTNAQIFAVNKFVNSKGGLILAGDPGQEIRNRRITMAQLDVNIKGGRRYSQELTQNFRSSVLIQNLGNEYKQEPCLHIKKNTKSVEGITAGPPPQIFITNDTETSNYQETYNQIVNSVRMCTEDLCIVQENICIVAFNEPELLEIQKKLYERLGLESVLIYKNFSFNNKNDSNGKVRLCTLRDIKGIDCAVLLFMITDQSKQINNGGIKSELKANAIYTCITRAMYLLQVFVPKYCRLSDLSVAVLVNKLLPEDEEVAAFIEEQNKKERKGIPTKDLATRDENETDVDFCNKVENILKKYYEKKFGSNDNCFVDITEDLQLAYVYSIKKVVEDVQDALVEISINEASLIRPECTVGDEIDVYVNPSEIYVKSNNDFEKILVDAYRQFPERRTDENGNPLPNSSEGYLNIAGSGLSKPHEFGYEKWPDLIKDNSDKFDHVLFSGKGSVRIFAFRPKLRKVASKSEITATLKPQTDLREKIDSQQTAIYSGTVMEMNEILMKISTENIMRYHYLKYIPAYYAFNQNMYDHCALGDTVNFEIVENPQKQNRIMARLVNFTKNKALEYSNPKKIILVRRHPKS